MTGRIQIVSVALRESVGRRVGGKWIGYNLVVNFAPIVAVQHHARNSIAQDQKNILEKLFVPPSLKPIVTNESTIEMLSHRRNGFTHPSPPIQVAVTSGRPSRGAPVQLISERRGQALN